VLGRGWELGRKRLDDAGELGADLGGWCLLEILTVGDNARAA
jgi:hypothetical protein